MRLGLFILLTIVLIGSFLRFYKLDWGQGLFTHPDEYHIARSVSQLSFPNQMNPNFFSYGTVIIYPIYFTQEIIKTINSLHDSLFIIHNSFLLGRFFSAFFSILTIIIVYKISRFFMNRRLSYLTAFLIAISPGLIQQAHFATPESTQIFFLLTTLFFTIKFAKYKKITFLILSSIFLGLSLGTKISSAVFMIPLAIAILINSQIRTLNKHNLKSTISSYIRIFSNSFILLFISVAVTIATLFISSPFIFLDFQAFWSNLIYESGLAAGEFQVFYTRQFINTVPVIFQIKKILPYALGPVLLLFSIFGLLFVMLNLFQHLGFKPKKILKQALPAGRQVQDDTKGQVLNDNKAILLILIAFLSLLISNSFLFAKWTRFISPAFPFFVIFATLGISIISNRIKKSIFLFLTYTLILFSSLWSIAFMSIYINPDVRITANEWILSNADPDSKFLVEGGNMTDIPISGNYQKTSLDFYSFEQSPQTRNQIYEELSNSDYFIIQSRRVFVNHQRLSETYPKTAKFYDELFKTGLGFEQVKEFHSYPMLQLGNFQVEFPDEKAEETWSVFDHPVIRIFKKNEQLTKEEYASLLNDQALKY